MKASLGAASPATIALSEYESIEIALPREVYAAIRARFSGQLDTAPTERRGVYRLTARDSVGRVSLPGGYLLAIRPKISVGNLFYMLSAASGLARFFPPPAGLTPNPEIFSFILAMLVDRAEDLVRKGLYTEHLPVVADHAMVRGRILLSRQVALHAGLQHRHVCAYTQLTPDTPENRVVYAALRLVPALLGPEEDALRHRVRSLLHRFEGVEQITGMDALASLRVLLFHRLNAAYAPVLGLCRLALQHLTLDERPGPHLLASFLVNMPRLFESFATEQLRTLLRSRGLRVVAQRYDYLDEARSIGIRPDVLVYGAQKPDPTLVIDAKYRRPNDEGGINRDLYQVGAYMDRYGLERGALVYPKQVEERGPEELRIQGSSKRISILTLDIGAPSISALDADARLLASRVAALCGRSANS